MVALELPDEGSFKNGDKVRLRDKTFTACEAVITNVDETVRPVKLTVEVQFWGRPVKIDSLEYWQVDKV